MPKSFEELMEELRNPGENGPGETIYDDLNAAYNDRISAADAKVTELSTNYEKAQQELTRTKAHNYELLTAVPQGNPVTPSAETAQSDVDEPVITLDDIISYG